MHEPALIALSPTADRVFVNGKVVTVNGRDEVADALATAGNRILRVGSRPYVEQVSGPATQVIDLRGRALTPGLTDNHIHTPTAPRRRGLACRCGGAASIADMGGRAGGGGGEPPPGGGVGGGGSRAPPLAERRTPPRLDLDPVSPN